MERRSDDDDSDAGYPKEGRIIERSCTMASRLPILLAVVEFLNLIYLIVEAQVDPYSSHEELARFAACAAEPVALDCPWLWIDTAFSVALAMLYTWEVRQKGFRAAYRSHFKKLQLLVLIFTATFVFYQRGMAVKILRPLLSIGVLLKVKSIYKIALALRSGLLGTVNVLMLALFMVIIVSLFAHSFFGLAGYNCQHEGSGPEIYCAPNTDRGLFYGEEFFGSFGRSMYTIWQVIAGDSEAVTRPLAFDPSIGWASVPFFAAFAFMGQYVFLAVITAVMLEKMVAPEERGAHEEEGKADNEITEGGKSDLARIEKALAEQAAKINLIMSHLGIQTPEA